jgi:hypothetical protein
MRVLRYWRIGVGAAVALSVGVALAADPAVPTYPECTKKASKEENEAAKNAHKVAALSYDQGDYEKAIRYWTDAYGFDCSVNDLLINIANAYEKKGDRPGAVATLEAYLKRTGPNSNIEAKITNLKAAMAPQPTATPSVSAPPTASAPPTVSAPPTASAPPPDLPHHYGNTPWFVVGGGGVVALVGLAVLAVGASNYSSASSACPTHVGCLPSVTSQGTTGLTEQAAGGVVLGVGLAAAAGGLLWQLAFNKPVAAKPVTARGTPAPPATGLWVKPMVGRDGAPSGGMVGGSF